MIPLFIFENYVYYKETTSENIGRIKSMFYPNFDKKIIPNFNIDEYKICELTHQFYDKKYKTHSVVGETETHLILFEESYTEKMWIVNKKNIFEISRCFLNSNLNFIDKL